MGANSVDGLLHLLAGIVLFLFAASHFGFLAIRDGNHDLKNPVFTFISNRGVYAVAAVLETAIGIACLRRRGRNTTNVVVWMFVAAMVWYRWAFHYVGGDNCGCLGFLGKLLHANKTQEKAIPVAALILLALTTTPWLCRVFCRSISRYTTWMIVLAALLFPAFQSASGEQIIEVIGTVDLQDYNPNTGQPHKDQHSLNTFAVTLSGDKFRICITNNDWPQWAAQVNFDGTNTYTILPFSNALHPPFGAQKSNTNPPPTDLQRVIIEPSSRFIQRDTENLGLSMTWLTYCFSCQWSPTNSAGLIELSLPLSGARRQLGAFGYKWVIVPSEGGRFVNKCDVVRDKSLDLGKEEELLRPEFDYPETLTEYNENVFDLTDRYQIASGLVKSRYRCLDLLGTNGIVIPIQSTFESFINPVSPDSSHRPFRIIKLKATTINVRDGVENLLPRVSTLTAVEDYRYKRADKVRIFKYAEYKLNPGDPWKSSHDPELLAQAVDWMQHGRKFKHFANQSKVLTTWLVLLFLIGPLIIAWCVSRKHNKKGKT
jgi:hypothetical protein